MCTSPLRAYRVGEGISFHQPIRKHEVLYLPCGQCIECRLEYARQWAVRIMHEAKLWPVNSFVTLTYEVLPSDGNLCYRHFQLFMKRLRKRFPDRMIRFYMCGEYGSVTERAHYHAVLFNCDFDDKVHHKKSSSGFPIFTSELLDDLWGFGHCWIGEVTFESAGYVARYVIDKLKGQAVERDGIYVVDKDSGEVYVPEFTKMSLKPGIGRFFYDKFKKDIFPHDRVILNGKKMAAPRYYSRIYAESNPVDWERISALRQSRIKWSELEEDRLVARDKVNQARLSMLKRFDI